MKRFRVVLTAFLPAIGLALSTAVQLRAGEIHDAAAAGDLNKVKTLLEADAALLESKGNNGFRPLHSACFAGKVEVANLLLDRGADVKVRDNFQQTPLHRACYVSGQDAALVRRLIDQGADVNAQGYNGLTPLHFAALHGDLEIAALLLDRGADPNSFDSYTGTVGPASVSGTALQVAIDFHPKEAMARLLAERGAKVNRRDSSGNTELHLAAFKGYAELTKRLLALGAEVEAVNQSGRTALYYAAKLGYRSVADALIAGGAKEGTIAETNFGPAPQLAASLREGEAYLWSLNGGFAVKTRDHLLILGESNAVSESAEAGLANGHLNPAELKGQRAVVFVNHIERWRPGPEAFELGRRLPGVDFVFSYKPDWPEAQQLPHRVAEPNASFSVGGIQVRTIPALCGGLGYLVEVDGVRILDAGLHVSSNKPEDLAEFRKQIDFLKTSGPIDIAILSVQSHTNRVRTAYEPYLYLIDELAPKQVLLTKANNLEQYAACANVLKQRPVVVSCPESIRAVGDRFHIVRDRKSEPPLPTGESAAPPATCLAAQETTNPGRAIPASSPLRLEMATLLGGKSDDRVHGAALDAQGNIYLTAPIRSGDFPVTADALNKTPTGVYLAKLSPAGVLLYSTFLGVRSGANYAHGVAVDKEGCIYLAGNTTNPNFPTTPGAFQTTCKGPTDRQAAHGDAFVVKLSPAGDKVIYSTFLGGSGADICGKIAVDAEGSAYVVGSTSSKDFPVTPGAFQTTCKGGDDGTGHADVFIAKLSPDGSRLVYSTYISGSGVDFYSDLALEADGSVCLVGSTTSLDFRTTPNALSRSFKGSSGRMDDAFIVTLNPAGTALIYASYLGGSGGDFARSLAVDRDGNVWVAGETSSADFPTTTDAICRQPKGETDGFFVKINPRDGKLLHSSLLGGGKSIGAMIVAIHQSGLLVLAGQTESMDFPVTPGALGSTLKGKSDLFVALFDPAARSLRHATLFGGTGNDVADALLCREDSIYVAGNTTSTDFPVTTGATFQGGTNPYGGDAFVARFTLVDKSGAATKETK
jgi:ankyrin repeat protein